MFRKTILAVAGVVALSLSAPAWAGAIFLTGHDPDYHAYLGGSNAPGAQDINTAAINFVTDPAFNPYAAGGVNKFLFVQSLNPAPPGQTNGVNGIIASGYTQGVDFELHGATTLDAKLNLLGSKYDALVIGSDYGGILTQAELDILNARSADIINFLNAGGGLYAMAESNGGFRLTPNGGHFGFLPFIVSSTPLDQIESGNNVTPFGAGLGLAPTDVNGNVSHNVFDNTGGLNVVDFDAAGRFLSLAGRGQVNAGTGLTNNIPEPGTLELLAFGLAGFEFERRRRKA